MANIGELWICSDIKNRWGIKCTCQIINDNEDGTCDILVYNMNGPGANVTIEGYKTGCLERVNRNGKL